MQSRMVGLIPKKVAPDQRGAIFRRRKKVNLSFIPAEPTQPISKIYFILEPLELPTVLLNFE